MLHNLTHKQIWISLMRADNCCIFLLQNIDRYYNIFEYCYMTLFLFTSDFRRERIRICFDTCVKLCKKIKKLNWLDFALIFKNYHVNKIVFLKYLLTVLVWCIYIQWIRDIVGVISYFQWKWEPRFMCLIFINSDALLNL